MNKNRDREKGADVKSAPNAAAPPNVGSSVPGVIVLALAATVLFAAVLIGLWKSGMLPAPPFLAALFGSPVETDDGGMAEFIASLEANPPLDSLDPHRVEIGPAELAKLLGASYGAPGTSVYEIVLSSPQGGGLLKTRATVTTKAADPDYWFVELERWDGEAYKRIRRVVCDGGVVTVTENSVAADGSVRAQNAEYPASPTFTAEREAGLPPVSGIIAMLSAAADAESGNEPETDISESEIDAPVSADGSDGDIAEEVISASGAAASETAADETLSASDSAAGGAPAPQLELSLVRGTSTAADSRNIAAIRATYPDGLVDYYEIDVESARLIRAISYLDGVPYYSVTLFK